MKNLFKSLLLAAAVATTFAGCNSTTEEPPIDKPEPTKPDAPTITLAEGNIDEVQEITDKMSVKVYVSAEGGIKTFTIGIDSPALTAEELGKLGLAAQLDLINPATPAMDESLKTLGFPTGASITGSTNQEFNLSTLIPMIKAIYTESSNHNFTIKVTDNEGQSVEKTLKFHLTGASTVTYNNDADLWKNTATLSAKVQAEGEVTIEYKKSTETVWQKAETKKNADGTYSASIAPTWTGGGKHASGADLYTLDGKTGVFAGHTYNYRLMVAGNEMDVNEFATTGTQKIPFGDMNTWSQYVGYSLSPEEYESAVDYPNESVDNQFWANGNNNFVKELCTPLAISDTNFAAKLKGNLAFSVVFAAGNLFSGVFEMDGIGGYARFGQKYAFTARPTAIKVRVKTTINNITNVSTVLTPPNNAKVGDTDQSRIFACITDWTERHSVYSGLDATLETLNAFDPVTDTTEPQEGKVIAYGSKAFGESITEWQELVIPIIYKDKEAKPAADNYSLVISCASSAYGDFLCGCPDNELVVDDFEWVY